jgi:hypothetical protein
MISCPRLARPRLTAAALMPVALITAVLTGLAAAVSACGVAAGASAGAPAVPVRAAAADPSGADTFLAEGQDIGGTALHKPPCPTGCVLSGDATSILVTMTWSTWTATRARGTGIERIENCVPNCAAGGQYRVPVVVVFSHPVKECAARTGVAGTGSVAGAGSTARRGTRWFWSRAWFSYPRGLPKALRGASAPRNPWIFTPVIDQARASCG